MSGDWDAAMSFHEPVLVLVIIMTELVTVTQGKERWSDNKIIGIEFFFVPHGQRQIMQNGSTGVGVTQWLSTYI